LGAVVHPVVGLLAVFEEPAAVFGQAAALVVSAAAVVDRPVDGPPVVVVPRAAAAVDNKPKRLGRFARVFLRIKTFFASLAAVCDVVRS
jgi:hypothetical protein